jgi:hypothetical protein
LLQKKTRGSSSCPLCIPKKRQTRILENKKYISFTIRKKVVWTIIKCAACTPWQEKQTVGK